MLADGDAIVDYRVWLDNADTLTALYVQQLEPVYWRAPAAPGTRYQTRPLEDAAEDGVKLTPVPEALRNAL